MRQFLREAKDSNTNFMHTLPVAMTVASAARGGERSPSIQSTMSAQKCLSDGKRMSGENPFPGNSENHFFSMSKSNPTVYATYGHVSHGVILYPKPKGPYIHLVKYHRDWSSHSRVEICA